MTLLICNTSCEQNCGLNATLARVVTLEKNTLKTSDQKQSNLTRYQLMHIIEYLYLTNIHFHGQHKTYKYTRQNLQDKIIIGNSTHSLRNCKQFLFQRQQFILNYNGVTTCLCRVPKTQPIEQP